MTDYNPGLYSMEQRKTYSIPNRQLPEGTIRTWGNGSQYKKEMVNGSIFTLQKRLKKRKKFQSKGKEITTRRNY